MLKAMILTAVLFVFSAAAADAQPGRRFYVDAGWQFNGTVGNDFASNGNGWGAYIEGGYYVLPRIAVGLFGSFNTNNEYVPRCTYMGENGSALTTDKVNSIYQVPFGATLRYRFSYKVFQPYIQAKLGANYAQLYLASVPQEQLRIPVCGILQLCHQPQQWFRSERYQQCRLQARSVILSVSEESGASDPSLRSG